MKYTVIIEKGRESGYVAYVPALKGCVSQGKTRAEVQKNIKEAIGVYVEALEDTNDIELINRRQNEPSRPFRKYLADR